MEYIGSNTLTMLAQELVGAHLCDKLRPERHNDLHGELADQFRDGEYAALIRATGYAIGAGQIYGTGKWCDVCEEIRGIVRILCLGHNNDNTNPDDFSEIVGNVRDSLEKLSEFFRS